MHTRRCKDPRKGIALLPSVKSRMIRDKSQQMQVQIEHRTEPDANLRRDFKYIIVDLATLCTTFALTTNILEASFNILLLKTSSIKDSRFPGLLYRYSMLSCPPSKQTTWRLAEAINSLTQAGRSSGSAIVSEIRSLRRDKQTKCKQRSENYCNSSCPKIQTLAYIAI